MVGCNCRTCFEELLLVRAFYRGIVSRACVYRKPAAFTLRICWFTVEHSYFAWEQRQSKDFFDERESCKDVEKNDNTGGILLTAIIIFKFDENDQTVCILRVKIRKVVKNMKPE